MSNICAPIMEEISDDSGTSGDGSNNDGLANAPEEPEKPFPFMQLPSEIRRQIYGYLRPEFRTRPGSPPKYKPIYLKSRYSVKIIRRDYETSWDEFQQYLVSRQFCTEALEVLFERSEVTWISKRKSISSGRHNGWLIAPLFCLSSLTVIAKGNMHPAKTRNMKHLDLCSNLKHLKLKITVESDRSSDNQLFFIPLVELNNLYLKGTYATGSAPDDVFHACDTFTELLARTCFDFFNLEHIKNLPTLERLQLDWEFPSYVSKDQRTCQMTREVVSTEVEEMVKSTLLHPVIVETSLALCSV